MNFIPTKELYPNLSSLVDFFFYKYNMIRSGKIVPSWIHTSRLTFAIIYSVLAKFYFYILYLFFILISFFFFLVKFLRFRQVEWVGLWRASNLIVLGRLQSPVHSPTGVVSICQISSPQLQGETAGSVKQTSLSASVSNQAHIDFHRFVFYQDIISKYFLEYM